MHILFVIIIIIITSSSTYLMAWKCRDVASKDSETAVRDSDCQCISLSVSLHVTERRDVFAAAADAAKPRPFRQLRIQSSRILSINHISSSSSSRPGR